MHPWSGGSQRLRALTAVDHREDLLYLKDTAGEKVITV